MDISGAKLSLNAHNSLIVRVRSQTSEHSPNHASSTTGNQETVSISSQGKQALAASTGAALHQANPAGKASVTEAVDSDEGLSPIEKQIKDLKEKIKEFKEQLRELKGENSEEAVEQRKLIQQQIMILNGMIATLSKKLNDQTVATPPKG
jgi:predicted RNase H-like nuclease (RuvC/YqgF family)